MRLRAVVLRPYRNGFEGENYRLLKDNLEKDIVPDSCSYKVKNNKVVIKLAKKKGEFSYENLERSH